MPAKGLTGVVEPTNFVSYDFLLWTHTDPSHWLAFGLADRTPVFYRNAPFWEPGESASAIAAYPASEVLASGWIQGEDRLAGKAALLELPYGEGRVVLAGFSPEYRAQSHATFKILFNAIFQARPEGR